MKDSETKSTYVDGNGERSTCQIKGLLVEVGLLWLGFLVNGLFV